MHFQVLASGSKGNSYLVRAGESHVLVDAGLSMAALARRLEDARVEPTRVEHVAVTHGHLDHARSVGILARRSGARVLACRELWENSSMRRAKRKDPLEPGEVHVLEGDTGEELTLRGVRIPHDADPTVAVVLDHGDRRAVVITDMGRVVENAAAKLTGAHLLLLEFNHDLDLLAAGPYPEPLQRRIRGPLGHLSNEEAARMLELVAGPELHTLVLAHLSETNNRPDLALAAARGALARIGREDVRVEVATQDEIGPNLAV